jgi:hypothetical protein
VLATTIALTAIATAIAPTISIGLKTLFWAIQLRLPLQPFPYHSDCFSFLLLSRAVPLLPLPFDDSRQPLLLLHMPAAAADDQHPPR